MYVRQAVLHLLALLLLVCTTRAGLVNITIDDTYGDLTTGLKPIYQPSGSPWYRPGCSGSSCGTISPSASSAFDATWTAASYTSSLNNMTITLSFTGISVWAFFILANNVNVYGTNATTMCNFTLDGNSISAVSHQPSTSSDFQYNATVFSTSGLSNSQHELVISTDVSPSFICFDYAIYTADVPDSATFSNSGSSTGGIVGTSSTPSPESTAAHTSSSNSKLGIIVGSVLGGLALIALVTVLILFRRLRRKQEGPGAGAPIISSFIQQLPPQSYRDDVATSNTHLPSVQNPLYAQNHGSGTLYDPHSPRRRLPSSDFTSGSTPLTPVRRGFHSKSRDEVRAVRQLEINQRLQAAQQEMDSLATRQTIHTSSGPGSTSSSSGARRQDAEQEMETMREQIRQLRAQIEHLQVERSSDWGQGLSDEPPPAYD